MPVSWVGHIPNLPDRRRWGNTSAAAHLLIHGSGGLHPGDTTVLEAGMVIAIEPSLVTDEGYFHIEENLVVRETGYELLSAPTPAVLPATGDMV